MLFFSLNRYIFHQGILRTLWSCMYICRQRQRGGLYDVITMKWFHIEPCIIQNKDCRRTYKDFQTMTFSKSTRWNKMSRIHSDNSFIHTFPSHMGVSLRFVYVCSRCPFYDVYIAHMGIGKTLNHADSGLIQNEKQLWNSEILNMDNEHARTIYVRKSANCLHLQQRWA